RDALSVRAPRALRRRGRRGAPRVRRAADPARLRGARGRLPDGVRAEAPRGSTPQVRRSARVRRGLMRAVQLVRWQAEPEVREVAVPEPGPGEVLVEV